MWFAPASSTGRIGTGPARQVEGRPSRGHLGDLRQQQPRDRRAACRPGRDPRARRAGRLRAGHGQHLRRQARTHALARGARARLLRSRRPAREPRPPESGGGETVGPGMLRAHAIARAEAGGVRLSHRPRGPAEHARRRSGRRIPERPDLSCELATRPVHRARRHARARRLVRPPEPRDDGAGERSARQRHQRYRGAAAVSRRSSPARRLDHHDLSRYQPARLVRLLPAGHLRRRPPRHHGARPLGGVAERRDTLRPRARACSSRACMATRAWASGAAPHPRRRVARRPVRPAAHGARACAARLARPAGRAARPGREGGLARRGCGRSDTARTRRSPGPANLQGRRARVTTTASAPHARVTDAPPAAQAAHPRFRVRLAYCPNPTCQSAANCWPVSTVPPKSAPPGNASADAASARTRWLLPAGEGRPTTALTTTSSDTSPFGPHPSAPGTENVASPWTPPVIWSDPSAPARSGTPVGSKPKKPPMLIALDRSVFSGLRRIGFWSDPMKQLGPSAGFSRWILIGNVMIGTPV